MSVFFNWKLDLAISSFIPFSLIWGFMQGQFLRGNQKFGSNKISEVVVGMLGINLKGLK